MRLGIGLTFLKNPMTANVRVIGFKILKKRKSEKNLAKPSIGCPP